MDEPNEHAFAGGFVSKYMGKEYGDGETEIISMGLQHLSQLKSAVSFFLRDGEYVLSLLTALQYPQSSFDDI